MLKSGQDGLIGPGSNNYGKDSLTEKLQQQQADRLRTQALNTPPDTQSNKGLKKDDVPRRCRIDLYTPAEKAIYDAAQVVEGMDADVRLTDAVNTLWKAKDLVADYVDGVKSDLTDALQKDM